MVKWITVALISTSLLITNYDWIDVKEAISYYGQLIIPSSYLTGNILFLIILALLIIPKELVRFWKFTQSKIKLKESFNTNI